MLTKLTFLLCVALCAGVPTLQEKPELDWMNDIVFDRTNIYGGYNASYYLQLRSSAWVNIIIYHLESQGYDLTGSNGHTLEQISGRRLMANIEATNNIVDLLTIQAEALGVNISACVKPYTDFLATDARSMYLEGRKCDKTYKEFLDATLRSFNEFLWEFGNITEASVAVMEECYKYPENLILSCRKLVEPMALDIYNEEVVELTKRWRQERVYFNESKLKFIDCSIRLTDKTVKEMRNIVEGVTKCAENLMEAATPA